MIQTSLFENHLNSSEDETRSKQPEGDLINLGNATLRFFPKFIAHSDANKLFNDLCFELDWQQPDIQIYGKQVRIPRQQVWMGDQTSSYMYSGKAFAPQDWRQDVLQIKTRIESLVDHPLNSVLINHYRNGQDSVSWHSDNEPELNATAPIVSLSLGATRRFDLRETSTTGAPSKRARRYHLALAHGDVLVMSSETQRYWQHQIPKQNSVIEPRLNLTFRHIVGT